jgi:4-amino-4-deoxy-L-arabinose transferase-like glycosyltransferase
VPFIEDNNGLRFGKYPPGWPAALSLGVLFNIRDLINPILAALCVWLTYRLGKKLINPAAGLIAAVLTLFSPFFLINSSTLLSHTWSFFLTLAFILAWNDLRNSPAQVPIWMLVCVAGLSLGLIALSRPWTAFAVGLPFFIEGLILLIKKPGSTRLRIFSVGAIAVALGSLIFVWQFAVTGSPMLNPYTLWWPYDRIGFGPGIGTLPEGHSLPQAITNARINLRIGASDLFGWGKISWIFIPFGVFALRRFPRTWTMLSILPSMILLYLFYWVSSWIFGPRYYFEGLISTTIASAAGIVWLAGKFPSRTKMINKKILFLRSSLTGLLVAFLIGLNVAYYIPLRLAGFHSLYGASREQLVPFESKSAVNLTPALIIVHRLGDWREYGTLLELSSPYLDTPFIFTIDRGSELNQQAADMFPNRSVFYYYADQPTTFYTAPRAGSE